MSHHAKQSTTALRWRARMTREAIDSTLSLDETDLSMIDTEMSLNRRRWYHHYCCNFFIIPKQQFCLRLALVVAAGSLSLYSLLQASRSWQNAVTVTLQLAVLVVLLFQGVYNDDLRPLMEYRKHQAATRRQYQAIQEKNEKLLHKIRLHQTAMDRVGSILQELALYSNETMSVEALVHASKEQDLIRRDLISAYRRDLLQQVVSILLAQNGMEWDRNPFVPASTIERIVWVCKNAKALEFDETQFRERLVDDSSEVHVIKLLKVVADKQWKWSPEDVPRHLSNFPSDIDRDNE